MRSAEEIVYLIRLPDWQFVQIEKYESDEMALTCAGEILEVGRGRTGVLFV